MNVRIASVIIVTLCCATTAPPAEITASDLAQVRQIWKRSPLLHAAVKGQKRMNIGGLDDLMERREKTPADDIAEHRIHDALANAGMGSLATDAISIRCRGDICATVYIDRRPRTEAIKDPPPGRGNRAAAAARTVCGQGYPAAGFGGMPDGNGRTASFFCVQDADLKAPA